MEIPTGVSDNDYRSIPELLATATPERLRARSNGTAWTNEQLLFHMVFGILIVRRLLPLVFNRARMGWLCDRTIDHLGTNLEQEPEERLRRGTPVPTSWHTHMAPTQ